MRTIGRLRHQLIPEYELIKPDDFGGATSVWEALPPIWAAIESISGHEQNEGDGLAATISHRIYTRAGHALSPLMRLRSKQHIFEIISVRDFDGRNRFLICDAIERKIV